MGFGVYSEKGFYPSASAVWGVAVLPNFEGAMKGLDLFRVGSGLWIALNWDFVKELKLRYDGMGR